MSLNALRDEAGEFLKAVDPAREEPGSVRCSTGGRYNPFTEKLKHTRLPSVYNMGRILCGGAETACVLCGSYIRRSCV